MIRTLISLVVVHCLVAQSVHESLQMLTSDFDLVVFYPIYDATLRRLQETQQLLSASFSNPLVTYDRHYISLEQPIEVFTKMRRFEFPLNSSKEEIAQKMGQYFRVDILVAGSKSQYQHLRLMSHTLVFIYDTPAFNQSFFTMLRKSQLLQANGLLRLVIVHRPLSEHSKQTVELNTGIDQVTLTFNGDPYNLNELYDYLRLETLPYFATLDQLNWHSALQGHKGWAAIYLEYQVDPLAQKLLRQAANHNKYSTLRHRRVQFVKAQATSIGLYLKELELPQMQGVNHLLLIHFQPSFSAVKRFLYKGNFSEHTIGEFIQDCMLDKIAPIYKTQPESTAVKEQHYQRLVGSNLQSTIRNINSSYVLLVEDSTKHGRFNYLRQALDQALSQLGSANLRVGIFDVAKNQSPFLKISRVPEIVLYRRGAGRLSQRQFKGDEAEGLLKFLESSLRLDSDL